MLAPACRCGNAALVTKAGQRTPQWRTGDLRS